MSNRTFSYVNIITSYNIITNQKILLQNNNNNNANHKIKCKSKRNTMWKRAWLGYDFMKTQKNILQFLIYRTEHIQFLIYIYTHIYTYKKYRELIVFVYVKETAFSFLAKISILNQQKTKTKTKTKTILAFFFFFFFCFCFSLLQLPINQ